MGSEDLDLRMAELHAAVVGDESFDQLLARVARLAVDAVPACTDASVTLTPSSEPGPADLAVESAAVIVVPTADGETPWPAYTERLRHQGVVSVLSVPLRWGDHVVGALELRSTSRPFTSGDAEVAGRFAEQAAVAVANAQEYRRTLDLVANLRSALGSRDIIGQAKGVLMARHGIDAEQAFELLRRRSQDENVKLRDVARQVVEGAGTAAADDDRAG